MIYRCDVCGHTRHTKSCHTCTWLLVHKIRRK